MPTDVVDIVDIVQDSRVVSRAATVNGHTYKFLYGEPGSGRWRATAFLIHGWPDLSIGWRAQIPVLLDMGLRVVCPDLMGFGGTDAPVVPPESLALYSLKRASDDIRELARRLGSSRIILGGHDWGGFLVYRCVLWHPDLISHVFSICTPFTPPSNEFVSLEDVVKRAPQFGYQIHLAGPEVEVTIKSKDQIRQFLNGIYGAKGASGELLFDPRRGLLLDNLPRIGKSSLVTEKEVDYYVQEYSRHGLHGTLNWYRTRTVNHAEELALPPPAEANGVLIDIPTLYIAAKRDNVLLPSMSKGMERSIPQLTRREVDAGHWALWQAKDEVNAVLKEWFENVVFGDKVKL